MLMTRCGPDFMRAWVQFVQFGQFGAHGAGAGRPPGVTRQVSTRAAPPPFPHAAFNRPCAPPGHRRLPRALPSLTCRAPGTFGAGQSRPSSQFFTVFLFFSFQFKSLGMVVSTRAALQCVRGATPKPYREASKIAAKKGTRRLRTPLADVEVDNEKNISRHVMFHGVT